MPIRSYLMPENAAANAPRLSAMKDHIAVLASLFGEYPFVDTKYGIVSSWFSGGMEHPTMTSIGENILSNIPRNITVLLVHELSHQWWGDRVTMRTWDDIWLNEGFATYCEVLYLEKALGRNPGQTLSTAYDDGLYGGRLAHAVVADPADPLRLHRRRLQQGRVLPPHAAAPRRGRRLLLGPARLRRRARVGNGDARASCARSSRSARASTSSSSGTSGSRRRSGRRSGRRTARPSDASTVTLTITQTQQHVVVHPVAGPNDKPFYVFPLVVRITHVDGSFDDVTVVPTAATTVVDVPNPSKKFVAGITLDPGSGRPQDRASRPARAERGQGISKP